MKYSFLLKPNWSFNKPSDITEYHYIKPFESEGKMITFENEVDCIDVMNKYGDRAILIRIPEKYGSIETGYEWES